MLTGGGAQFGGLDDYLRDETKLPVRIADEPRYAIVRGLEEHVRHRACFTLDQGWPQRGHPYICALLA